MSEFLLLAARPPAGEVSLAGLGRELAACTRFHAVLRGWGLSRGFAVADEPRAEPACCVLVRASSRLAALRMARVWEHTAGYVVAVIPYVETAGAA